MIKVRSIYNLKSFRDFQRYTLKKIFILAYCFGILLLCLGILFAFLEKKVWSAYLLVGVIFPVIVHAYSRVLEIESLNKNIYLKKSVVQLFTFNEDGFELEQISNFDDFKEVYLYKDIIKVIKYKKYYFMYINRAQAFIVNNEDYIYGNEEGLDKLFKEVKGERFVLKTRKKCKEKNLETTR